MATYFGIAFFVVQVCTFLLMIALCRVAAASEGYMPVPVRERPRGGTLRADEANAPGTPAYLNDRQRAP